MLTLVQGLNTFAGLISVVLLLVVAIVSGRSMSKSNVNSATIEAQEKTINAMKEEMGILRDRLEDVKSENTRLKLTIDTICAALKIRGLVITIQGEMVNIEDKNGKTTTTRIHDKEGNP